MIGPFPEISGDLRLVERPSIANVSGHGTRGEDLRMERLEIDLRGTDPRHYVIRVLIFGEIS